MSPHDDSRPEDRLDRLLSADLDGEIDSGDRAWLEERLARDPTARARLEAFARIDTGLRRLAEAPVGQERLAAMLADLHSRLEAETVGASDAAEKSPSDVAPVLGAGRFPVRPWASALAVAAAAAIAVLLLLPGSEDDSEAPAPSLEMVGIPADAMAPEGPASDRNTDAGLELDADLEEGLSVVLGYGEDPYAGDEPSIEDLEVIEQLDLLDFLSSRETAGRG
ncbi:MAG TPA: hypothetical protein ENI85_11080 [Deltaproteobacteria bacterium]|nr:hypothetical protein [Deltaproteobacteria bacterium]